MQTIFLPLYLAIILVFLYDLMEQLLRVVTTIQITLFCHELKSEVDIGAKIYPFLHNFYFYLYLVSLPIKCLLEFLLVSQCTLQVCGYKPKMSVGSLPEQRLNK